MPEGHLLHRYGREHAAALAGRAVAVSSPQGRFDPTPFDGHVVRGVEVWGKHLFYAFENGDDVDAAPALHVHLGHDGFFLRTDDPALPPRAGTRLRFATDAVAFSLVAPMRCEAVDPAARDALVAKLGPDPLRENGSVVREEAVRRLTAKRSPVGTALLDQAVWAGLGNAWRAELLFLAGIDPARRVDAAEAGRLWDLAVVHLALGVETGLVVSDPEAPAEKWVYKRDTCRRCGAGVRTWSLGGRTTYACPAEQR